MSNSSATSPPAADAIGLADAIILSVSSVFDDECADPTPYAINASITMVGGMDGLTIRDLLTLIAWVRDFTLREGEKNPRRKSLNDSDTRAQCDTLLAELRDEYRKRARLQVRGWFQETSWQREMDVIENSEGRLVTADPEDMVFAIKTQLSVANEYLSPHGYMDLMAEIACEIKTVQARMETALESDWEAMGVERLCTVVNDCVALSEEYQELFIPPTKNIPTFELKKSRDEVTRGYLSLALQATNLVPRSIFLDLQPILADVFSSNWQDDNGGDVVSVCTATLCDYFGDLSSWLPRNFYCRVVRRCLVLLVEGYLEGGFSQPQKPMFHDARTASALLLKDKLNFVEFFGTKYLKEVGLGGKGMKNRKNVEDEFEILGAMSTIIVSEDCKDALDQIYIMIRELGAPIGKAAVLYLVQKSRQCSRKQLQSWKDELQSSVGEDSLDMIQPRFDCDLSHLLKERSKLQRLELISDAFHLQHLRANTKSVRRKISKHMPVTPFAPLSTKNSSGSPDKSNITSETSDQPSGRTKVSIKALVQAELFAQKLLPVAPKAAEMEVKQDEPATEEKLEEVGGYHFGDITRSLVAKGKKKDGRDENDPYKPGDLSRGILCLVLGSEAPTRGGPVSTKTLTSRRPSC